MKKLILSAALTLSSFAFASSWEIDSAHAAANFAVKHLMVSTVNGTLGDVTGKVEIDDKDLTKSKIEASIDVKGINTKQSKRDEHLRSPDFFDVEKFPAVTFKSTKIEKGEGNKVKVTGDLTIKSTTKSVVLDGELSPEVANPWDPSKKVRGFSGTATINRKDFGLTWNKPLEAGAGVLVGDDVKISIEAELGSAAKAAPAKAPAAPAKK
jgi:polyisoprenoid-binding protein YceI